ncbi:MAG: vanadium-dependent haloperoxidase [Spirosomataceae bacterium]
MPKEYFNQQLLTYKRFDLLTANDFAAYKPVMKKYVQLTVSMLLVGGLLGCAPKSSDEYKAQATDPKYLHSAEEKLTEVIVHDIFSPPVASRIYAYCNVAAYEALVNGYPKYQSLAGQLNKFEAPPKPEQGKEYCFELASLRAFMGVARTLTFSVQMYDEFEKGLYKSYEEMGMSSEVYERSMKYGEAVAAAVMAYAKKDNYPQTRGFRHTVTNAPGTWVPTPPAYMDAVEPLWTKIRPMTLDSSSQFKPAPPTKFSEAKGSAFYKDAMVVYETGVKLTEQQKEIANFWDCNPFKMNVQGHAMFATKKISPGGHWMSIAGLVSRQSKADMMRTSQVYTLLSMTLFDAFISCWDEKYRSILVRPETYINNYIDDKWQPLLQTPPFPEYTSGHSVASNSSAVVLTSLFGDNFAYADSTEVRFGIPVRSYKSFKEAAAEASISRMYGGIHYMPAINEGATQGKRVGEWVLKKIKMEK